MHISGSTFCLEPALLEWLSSTSLANFSASVNLEPEKLHVTFADLEGKCVTDYNSLFYLSVIFIIPEFFPHSNFCLTRYSLS